MNAAKIRLSQKEMELVTNADLILTKNAILNKVKEMLAKLQPEQERHLQLYKGKIPEDLFLSSPKISKGENYNGLPYLILDFPKVFNTTTVYAIRTMFWWGNFFSITLHLSGTYKKKNEEKIIAAFEVLQKNGFFYCANDEEWEHHFEPGNYISLTTITKECFEKEVGKKDFIKLAHKIPLQQWVNAEENMLTCFKQLIKILAD